MKLSDSKLRFKLVKLEAKLKYIHNNKKINHKVMERDHFITLTLIHIQESLQ